jgi:hypothetical protein
VQVGRDRLAQAHAEVALLHAARANGLRRVVARGLGEHRDAVRIDALVARLLCEHSGASPAVITAGPSR